MSRTVTVGLDCSTESLAATDWAAREAVLRVAPLCLDHACGQQPYAYVPFARGGGVRRGPVRADAARGRDIPDLSSPRPADHS
jgi:hypothetical protein